MNSAGAVSFNQTNYSLSRTPSTSAPVHTESSVSEATTPEDQVALEDKLFSDCSKDVKALARRAVGRRGDLASAIVSKGTDGNDTINIQSAERGSLKVSINGEETTYTSEQAKTLIIDGGNGNDTITADSKLLTNLFITGGEGNDTITGGSGSDTIIDSFGCNVIRGGRGADAIIAQGEDFQANSGNVAPTSKSYISAEAITGSILIGGGGNDYIEGGQGNDLIVGGQGNDVIYGVGGNDLIAAGKGSNYVDGGQGNDVIRAGSGRDRLFGGQGNDNIQAGDGADIIVPGRGQDTVSAELGANKIISTPDDTIKAGKDSTINETAPMDIPESFKLSGSEGFKERVASDLESLASTEIGQTMLTSLADSGKTVSFTETAAGNQCSSGASGNLGDDRKPGEGSDSTVYYNRATISLRNETPWQERPPIVGLYHEMVHSYNAATGTMDRYNYDYNGGYAQDIYGVSGAEIQAVGIEHRMVKPNPEGLSENAMRDFLSLPKRERY